MKMMPASVSYFNGSTERCDILDGPCACGAWHKPDEWESRLAESRFRSEEDRALAIAAVRAALA